MNINIHIDINMNVDINMNIDIRIIIHMNNNFGVVDHFQVLRVSDDYAYF